MIINSINSQITLPTELYYSIQKRAQRQGHSFNREIVTLLSNSLTTEMEQLEEEFALWEAASDEDWLNTEAMLTKEEL